jgi:hypothetical protein
VSVDQQLAQAGIAPHMILRQCSDLAHYSSLLFSVIFASSNFPSNLKIVAGVAFSRNFLANI